MRRFQKIISIVCMLAVLFCMTACGSSSDGQGAGRQPETPVTESSSQKETDETADTESQEQEEPYTEEDLIHSVHPAAAAWVPVEAICRG